MAIQELARETYAFVQGLFERVIGMVISRDTREKFYAAIGQFAKEQPFLASFLLIQLILVFLPFTLFASFVIATVLFSFITALLFSLFWLGAALLVLVPTLFVTVSLGIVVWIWAVCSFLATRWAYNMLPLGTSSSRVDTATPNGKTVVAMKAPDGYGNAEVRVKPAVPQKNFGTMEYN